MPKIDSVIDTMANTASIATKFAGAFSAADTLADTLSAFARPINTYDVEVISSPGHSAMNGLHSVNSVNICRSRPALLRGAVAFPRMISF